VVLTPYFATQTATAIDTAIRRMAATRALLTGKTTTFVRNDKDTGAAVNIAANVALISIAVANRDASQTGITQGATEVRTMGTFEVWAPCAIRPGDRFSWDGALCQVTRVAPAVHGIIAGAFELLKGVYG
jgi:hypothetical protein